MNVTFSCNSCQQTVTCSFDPETTEIACPRCAVKYRVPADSFADEKLQRCLVCPSDELFIRKDFPQRLGVAVVVLGFIASSIAWYYYQIILTFAILFATALIDVILYAMVGGVLVCYRCQAHYRGVEGSAAHGHFELETHERFRQQSARLNQQRAATQQKTLSG
jgi:uncharacterized protein YbaR (Trm112 family)